MSGPPASSASGTRRCRAAPAATSWCRWNSFGAADRRISAAERAISDPVARSQPGGRYPPKLVVTGGLISLAVGLAWTSTASASTSYPTIAGQMVLIGSGIGLTSAPATESIMGAVPKAKAGVGSAINDATRILGGTLGVAVIGSIYASLYTSRLTSGIEAQLPGTAADAAERSIGGAFEAADQLAAAGRGDLGEALNDTASAAFFHGFEVSCLVAATVAIVGSVFALILIPAHPPRQSD